MASIFGHQAPTQQPEHRPSRDGWRGGPALCCISEATASGIILWSNLVPLSGDWMQNDRRAPRWPLRSLAFGILGAMLAGVLLYSVTGRGWASGLGVGAATGLVMAAAATAVDYVERWREARRR